MSPNARALVVTEILFGMIFGALYAEYPVMILVGGVLFGLTAYFDVTERR